MKKRILCVEDTPQNMLLVKRILDALGFEMLEAVDGESGLETAVNHRPDLILLDLRLPGEISGFELARLVKAAPQLRHIPVVVLTAYGYEEAEQKARAAGCDGFLSKPADIRQIRATIDRFLAPDAPSPAAEQDSVMQQLAAATYTFI